MATTGKNGPGKPKTRRKPAVTAQKIRKRTRPVKAIAVEEAQLVGEEVLAEQPALPSIAAEMAARPPVPLPGVRGFCPSEHAGPPRAPESATAAGAPSTALVHVAAPPAIRARSRAAWHAGAGALISLGVLAALVAHHGRHAAVATLAPPPLVAAPVAAAPAASTAEPYRALGHRLFVEGRRPAALRAYEHALNVDPSSADAQMIHDLLDCYGHKDSQPAAAALIARFQLREAEAPLEALTTRGSHGTHWGAVYTLERLDRVPRRTYVNAFIADLSASSCDVRRRAAEHLASMESPRAVAALRAARRRAAADRHSCIDQASLRKDAHRG